MRAAVLVVALGFLAGTLTPASEVSSPKADFRRDFEGAWQNKLVYLLIPREQGEARGFRRRRTLVFRYNQPDSYARGVTRLGDEAFFDRFRVADIEWKAGRLEMVLRRPAYPEEYALVSARGVDVVVEIHFGGADFDPRQTNDILASFLVLEESFPLRLRLGGEGPPKLGEAIVDVSVARALEEIDRGLPSNAVESLLGTPLETQRMRLASAEYEYQWFADFHLLVLLRDSKVISGHWLGF